jgi:myosin-crossreactive antigen
MVSRVVPRVGQDSLDAFVTGAGPQSIRQAIFLHRDLGLTDGTEAYVKGMSRYGGSFPAASIDHIGAALRLVVTTPGTA